MLKITIPIYEHLSELLLEAIDGREFYSDDIIFEWEGVEYKFSATLMVYYRQVRYPEGWESEISNIVPVWWEFHSTTEYGEELNDMDFNELKEVICN